MNNNDSQLNPIPGLDVVGRGIYLAPHQPYELKGILFPQQNFKSRFCAETAQSYAVPEGYEVNDSPPMPAGLSLNQVCIEESVDRLDKANQIDASLSGGNRAFSVNANASNASMMRRNENAFYATRNSFLPFWSVYLSDFSNLVATINQVDFPVPFKHCHRKEYDRFFQQFGSHYVKRAWVGGRATLTVSVLKSTDISEQDIRMGLQASFGALGNTQSSSHLNEKKEKLANNAECTVAGKGGDAQLLAALNRLDETLYNQWITTIKDNPQSIELEVSGIWTLITDEKKSQALKAAYLAATAFAPICAVFCIGPEVYFIREGTFSVYNADLQESRKPQPLESKWPALKAMGFDRIDAALSGKFIGQEQNNHLNEKVFLFRGQWYVSYDPKTTEFSPPTEIAKGWPGVTFERIDAALRFDDEYVYLFCGKHYVRFNVIKNHVDEGYPALIHERWEGLHFDKIDAAVYWGNGKVYFFHDDQHIRYDVTDFRTDPGYPKHVLGSYVEDWKLFV